MPQPEWEHEAEERPKKENRGSTYQPAKCEEPFLDSLSDYEIGVRNWITDTMKGR